MPVVLALMFALMLSCSDLGRDNPLDPKSDKYVEIVKGAEGKFTDNRDNKEYKWIEIGAQIWMSENLNYRTPDSASRCYPINGSTNTNDADNTNCDIYGRMYLWATAMDIDSSCNTKNLADCNVQLAADKHHQGICPEGWHIPTDGEWTKLTNYVGGKATAGIKLRATSGWDDYEGKSSNGTDDYGFSGLPGGYVDPINSTFNALGSFGSWWSATEFNKTFALRRYMRNDITIFMDTEREKKNLYSLRCVKD